MNKDFNRYLLFSGFCLASLSFFHIFEIIIKIIEGIFGIKIMKEKNQYKKSDHREKEIKYWFSEVN